MKHPYDAMPQRDAAYLVGKTARTLRRLAPEGGYKNLDGSINGPRLVAFLIERATDDLNLDQQNLTDEQREWQTRRIRSLAETSEFNLQVLKGEYVPKEHVEKTSVEKILSVRNGLYNLVDRLPSQIYGLEKPEMFAVLKAEINIILQAFASVGGYDNEIAEKLKHELEKNDGKFNFRY
jgi:hypothetical protein